MLRRIIAAIARRWRRDRFGTMLDMVQRRSAMQLRRDHEAKLEIYHMNRIVNAARIAAAKGAVISTSRQVIGDGIDKKTAAVILQWLHAAGRK